MRSDRIFGVIWVLVAVAMGTLASKFEAPFSYEPIGPSKYPILLSVFNALCGLWLIARPGADPRWPEWVLWRKIFAMFAALLGYAFLFEPLGFMLATALLTLALGVLYGGTWKQCALGGALMGPGLYVLFDKLLDVTLPVGSLWTAA